MNATTDLQAGVTEEDGAFRRTTGAATATATAESTRGFLGGAELSALSTNALVEWIFGLVPQVHQDRR